MRSVAYMLMSGLLLLLPVVSHATDTHVSPSGSNGNACGAGSGSPKQTITNAINNCGAAGNRIIVHGGTYNEQLNSFTTVSWPSGTNFGSGAFVVMGAPGETARLRPTNSSLGAVINIYNGGAYNGGPYTEYIILDNLTIDASLLSGGGTNAVKLDIGSRRIRLQNSILIGNDQNTLTGGGLHFGRGGGATCNNDNGTGCLDDNPCCSGGTCVGYDTAYEILNNDISGSTQGYGVYVSGGYNVYDGNRVHDNLGYAMHLYASCYDQDIHHNIIRNTRMYNNMAASGGGPSTGNVFIATGHDNQVYNNLIYNNGNAADAALVLRYISNSVIYNNTITTNATRLECIALQSSGGSNRAQNNICWGNDGNQIVTDHGGDLLNTNLTSQNPRFVDPPNANYQLQTSSPRSPALDAALNLSSVFTSDITTPTTGLVRPATGSWDQGAYEMEAGGGSPTLTPEKGTFFIDDTGTNTTDCHAATGTVGSPSAAPFGTYATARVCMLAGSTLYFRAGTYPPLDTNVTPFSGGSPADGPTTLAAYPGETVTLQATGGSPVVFLHNSTTDHFIILQGFILDGQNITGTNGFAGYPGINDIRLDNMEIKNTYYEGVYLEQTSNVELRNTTRVHNSAVATVGVIGLNRTTNTTITGSEVYASGGPGISSYGGNTNLIIEKSTIRNTPSGKGIILGNASTPDSGVRIANNLIYTNTHGIHLQNGTTGVGLYYNTLWNNSVACMLFDSGVTVSEAINNVCWQVANVTNNAGSGMALTTNQCTGPTGCTAGDPLFASVTPGDANFLHLCGAAGAPVAGCTATSPAVDTGTPIPSLTSDYASKARPDGVQVDKGAFEEVPVPVPPAQVGLAPVYRTTHFLTLLP